MPTRSDSAIPPGRPGEQAYEAFNRECLEMAETPVTDELGKKVLAEFEKDQNRHGRRPEIRDGRPGHSRLRGRNFGLRSRSGVYDMLL